MIYLFFVQYMKHRIQLTQECWKYDLTLFIAPGARRTLKGLPDPIQGIKRLESIKVLGVIINDQLTAKLLILWPNSMELIATDSSRPVDVTAAVLCTTKD